MTGRLPLVASALLAACTADLGLPEAPSSPVVESFEPGKAFAGDTLTVFGSNFDPVPDHNLVRFEGGLVARAWDGDTGRLLVVVPTAVEEGPLQVVSPRGASVPTSVAFYPLGAGHPYRGTPVADLVLRHRPVGVVDLGGRIYLASSLFPLVLDEGGPVVDPGAAPAAIARAPEPAELLVSTEGEGGGTLLLVRPLTRETLAASAAADVVERHLFARAPGAAELAYSLGEDGAGRWWLTRWTRHAASPTDLLVPARRAIEGTVLGAAGDPDGTAAAAVRRTGAGGETRGLLVVEPGVADRWLAHPARWTWWGTEQPALPAGPLALVTVAGGRCAAMALEGGDVGVRRLDGAEPGDALVTQSFSNVHALVAAPTPGHLLLTKGGEGALYDYDAADGSLGWSAQLRGEPTLVDVEPGSGEIAVANDDVNGVDVLDPDGRWLGRSSFQLGLGSADGGGGGAATTFEYPRRDERPAVMHVLARTLGALLRLNTEDLSLAGLARLRPEAGPAVRLVRDPAHRTWVLHRAAVGLVESATDAAETLVLQGLAAEPRALAFAADGSVVVGFAQELERYEPDATPRTLTRAGGATLPPGAELATLLTFGDGVLVLWRGASDEPVSGARIASASLRAQHAAQPSLALPSGLRGYLGGFLFDGGPALLFSRSALPLGRPAVVRLGADGVAGPALPSALTGPLATGLTPDARFLVWDRGGGGEHLLALAHLGKDGLEAYSNYRLRAPAAGAAFDPSGEWMFVPIPSEDTISVFE